MTLSLPYAMLFPGQGAQRVDLMAGFRDSLSVRQTFSQAKEVLGIDYFELQHSSTVENLARTTVTQPLLLTCEVAVYRHWRALGGSIPKMVAGHSLGEYAALVAAESLEFDQALLLVNKRAQLMEAASAHGVGAMAAILNAELGLIKECCETAKNKNPVEIVEPVNYNTPEQVVIAGHRPAVIRCCDLLKSKGVKRAILLPVGGAFHSPLMQPATEGMQTVLSSANIKPPLFPVIHNADLQSHQNPDRIREVLAQQISAPVDWVNTIIKIRDSGITTLIESAPGKVLAGLNRRIDATMDFYTLGDIATVQDTLRNFGV